MGLWVQGVRIVPVFAGTRSLQPRLDCERSAGEVRIDIASAIPLPLHHASAPSDRFQRGGTVPPEKRFRINVLRGVRWRVVLARLLFVDLSSVAALYLAELAARQFFPEWGPTRAERVQFWRYDTLLG